MPKFHTISLDDAQRLLLEKTVRRRAAPVRTVTRARILLQADESAAGPGVPDTVIAETLAVGLSTVERTRKRAATEGIEAALQDRPRRRRPGKLDGAAQARLIALRCSPAPEGRERWTLELLARRFSAQEGISVSDELVRTTLKKTGCGLT
jgi:transposase